MKNLFNLLGILTLLAGLWVSCSQPIASDGKDISDYIVLEPSIIKGYRIQDKAPDYTIRNARIEGDLLLFDCNFHGLCAEHSFDLIFDGMYMKSLPMKAVLYLQHTTQDTCMKNVSYSFKYNMAPLLPPGQKELIIHLFGFDQELRYIKNPVTESVE